MANARWKKKYNIKLDIILIAVLFVFCGAAVLIASYCVPDSSTASGKHGQESSSVLDPDHMVYGSLVDTTIVLRFGDKKEILAFEQIADWLNVTKDENGYSYTVEDEKVDDYVRRLDEKYSNYQSHVDFATTYGETVRLENFNTGWIFNREYASDRLKEYIDDCRSVDIDLTDRSDESSAWWVRTSSDYNTSVTGADSYVEVSIGSQYMWVYKNKKVVLESSVVTGNPNTGNNTPKGAYIIYEKKSPSQLYGENYSTEVSYWIGFNDDIGFHDAEWQNEFGGSVYLSSGSHGCVNLPVDVAGKMYDLVDVNMPVYVH